MQDAKKIICRVPGMALGNVELDTLDLPAHVHDIDVAILPGMFGVAENAAVWVTDAGIKHRVVYFLPQHLVLVVPRAEIVNHLHEAYARLQFPGAGYGLFISGPSKTADIEQSLVIGAHGPRSLTVVLVGAYDTSSATASAASAQPIDPRFTGY
ncbi:MAG: LUD domain-containing protein [Planctomycetes bacterium]|nr:LUD domain-containing protein [Planctomycetota bacterium]